jgi:hypothetical protein
MPSLPTFSFLQKNQTGGEQSYEDGMVAYSFKRRFVDAIRSGLATDNQTLHPKRQTIRSERKRHAQPGEIMQLYCGLRTTACFKIGNALCSDVRPIKLDFAKRVVWIDGRPPLIVRKSDRDNFARDDGFANWDELFGFWVAMHGAIDTFKGVILFWQPVQSLDEHYDGEARRLTGDT